MADQSSTLKVEDLEEGKRYRVVLEGVFDGEGIDVREGGPGDPGYALWDNALKAASSIEKLPDPEPKWKTDTVVKVPGLRPFQYYGGAWYIGPINGGDDYQRSVSNAWKAGTLEILYQP